ncbi:hypothetical protein [Streptomyces sp. NPDC007929]|uniref:hypothetical protein n=1 Tax=unclassified Streptomyces TaxID=2593676 RepID=UPI0036ED1EF7
MPESHDPLRSLFEQAAEAGRRRAVIAPVSEINARGLRTRRRHVLMAVAGLTLAGAGAATAVMLPRDPAPAVPATPPSFHQPSEPPTTTSTSSATTTWPPPDEHTTFPPPTTTLPGGATTTHQRSGQP